MVTLAPNQAHNRRIHDGTAVVYSWNLVSPRAAASVEESLRDIGVRRELPA